MRKYFVVFFAVTGWLCAVLAAFRFRSTEVAALWMALGSVGIIACLFDFLRKRTEEDSLVVRLFFVFAFFAVGAAIAAKGR